MEQISNEFFVDLNVLNKNGNEKLKEFAINEELNVDDIIKIIYKEAERIGEKNKVKVTFETLEDDTFRINVEPINGMYKGTVIYPFTKIKSESKEILLDDVFGKLTLYNKKEISSQTTVTIDGVALDLFSMTYDKAKELLINISDRKTENGYIEEENSICFKQYGVKLNKRREVNEIKSIDVYNKEEFFDEFEFIEKNTEEKYDVDITKVGMSSSYEIPEFNVEQLENKKDESQEFEIEIEIPSDERNVEESTTKNNIENVENKEKVLEDKLSAKLKKFSTSNLENESIVENIVEESQKDNNYNVELNKEIEELTILFEKQREQQNILENRISKKLEELKGFAMMNDIEKKVSTETDVEDVDDIKIQNKDTASDIKSYIIESYRGIKEQGDSKLAIFLGESKDDIRSYFKTVPKEVKDYEEMEMYDTFYAYYDDEDKCTGIGIYNQEECKDKVALYLFGKNLITMPYKDIVKLIKDHDYKAIEDEDGIISLEYGISIDPKEDKDYKNSICDVIHIFKKGYYDEVYNI